MFKHIWHPEWYQGRNKKDRYFEGWYFKLVDAQETYGLALIPGISLNKKDAHAFIQIFLIDNSKDEPTLKMHYIRYGVDQFEYAPNRFEIKIADNVFTSQKVSLMIDTPDIKLSGVVTMDQITPIKQSILMPNIMGFFGYLTFMECYHGVISLSHNLHGSLHINQNKIAFDHGKGYLEKDWGKSFPRAYVWLQTNHFENSDASLMFSYADIPFLGMYFKGLISILHVDGKEYRFATYNGAKVKEEIVHADDVRYVIKKGRYLLTVEGKKDFTVDLPAPKDGVMAHSIKEGLSGTVKITLHKGKTLIFEGIGTSAGIEIMKPVTHINS